MNSSTVGLYIVGAFLFFNLIIGLLAGRNVKDIRDYAVGDKKYNTGALIMTYFATAFTGSNLFRSLKSFAMYGVAPFAGTIGVVISCIVRYCFIAPNMYKFRDCISMGDVFQKLYGKYAKTLSGLLGAIICLITIGMQIQIIAVIVEQLFEIDFKIAVVLSAIIISAYTALGGIRAVMATDIFQFCCLIISIYFITTYMVGKSGGSKSIFENIDPEKLSFFRKDYLQSAISIFFLQSIFSTEMVDPATFQRILMANSKFQLKKLFIFTAIGWTIYGLIRFMLASTAVSMNPNCTDNILIYIVKNLVPIELQGIVIVGLVAITFSSADSFLHGAGLSFYYDFIGSLKTINTTKLMPIRIITFILGLLSTMFVFSGLTSMNLSTIFAIIAPTICFPLIVGIAGLRSSTKSFWISIIAGVSSYFIIKMGFLGGDLQKLSTLTSSLFSAIVFLISSAYDHKGLFFDNNNSSNMNNGKWQRGPILLGIINSIKYNINLVKISSDKVREFGSSYTLFGLFYAIILVIPYLVWGDIQTIHEENLIYIKTIALALCSLLITHSIWPTAYKPYLPAFWYITLTYCLPFLSTIMLLLTRGAIEYTINIAINIMFLILLVDWISAIGIGLVGTFLAIGYYNFFFQHDPNESLFGFETIYLLVYQIIFGTVIGLLFARKKHTYIQNLNLRSMFLDLFKTDIVKSNQKSLNIIKSIETFQKENLIDPVEKILSIKKLVRTNNINIAKKEIAILANYLMINSTKIAPYCTLNAKKNNIYDFIIDLEKLLKAIGFSTVSIIENIKEKTIECDRMAILKVIWKLANDFYKKETVFKENDDTYITLIVFDTQITYTTKNNSSYNRSIDAIGIMISENDFIEENLFAKSYYKELINLEKIPAVNLEDYEQIDIDRTIEAHYGILQNLTTKENFLWNCVLPTQVYDIRPITLDLDAPIDAFYNWPEADELEENLIADIEDNFTSIDLKKVIQALNIIKKYHSHQTRKSGEPYYMHPMSVAKIVLQIIKDKDSNVYELLQKNQETILLAALLHDILEDTAMHIVPLTNVFGPEVIKYVKAVTKIDFDERAKLLTNHQAFTNLVEQEPITICIKLADRMHNLMTIDGHPNIAKRKSVAHETLDFFIEPAKKLKLFLFAQNLEEASKLILKTGTLKGFIHKYYS